MNLMEIINEYTADGLNLPIIHYESKSKNTCVICVHGMSGNILINKFAQVWGDTLCKHDIGFIFGHTRGHSYINDVICKNDEVKRIGTTYEIFKECLYDIDLFVEVALKLGYKKIVLLGHSLGANKVIYYMSKKINKNIIGVILASPPDMCGLCRMKKYELHYKEMLEEARKYVENNDENHILSYVLWDEYEISAKTFLSISKENGAVDNLPIYRNPNLFTQLSTIVVPLLAFESSLDDIIIRSVDEDLQLIKEKAISCPSFKSAIIKDTGHTYIGKEKETADLIVEWVKEL